MFTYTLRRFRQSGLALGLLLGSLPLAQAQLLQPDTSFGTAGAVATGLTGQAPGFSVVAVSTPRWTLAGQTLVQPDGKILVCGADAGSWTLRRYNANGTLDASFGTSGVVTSTFPSLPAVANGLALQPDGKIVVVGGISGAIGNVWAVARYSPQGVPDVSFGTAGLAYPDPSRTSPSELTRVAVLPDGRLLATVSYLRDSYTRLMRLLPDGQPDNTFGTNISGGGWPFNYGYSGLFGDMLAQPDGKVLVTTSPALIAGVQTKSARLARYNADGTPDTGFGTNGEAAVTGYSTLSGRQNIPVFTGIYSLALQPDGKILLAGSVNNNDVSSASPGEVPALFRFNANGTPDAAFNAAVAGRISSTGGFAAVTVQPDGSIVVGGATTPFRAYAPALMLARYSSAGVLDAAFGTSTYTDLPTGVYTASIGNNAVVRALLPLPNDQLLAWSGVSSPTASTADMRLMRYTARRPTATRKPELALQLLAAPVPASRQLHLRYTLPAPAAPRAIVRDQVGRVGTTLSATRQTAGAQELLLDLQPLAAGSYLVTLEAGQWQQTTRVLKQ